MKNTKSLDLIRPWGYIGYSILFSIPFIGAILVIVLSFAAKKTNLKYFARAYLWVGIIGIIIGVLVWIFFGQTIIDYINNSGLSI